MTTKPETKPEANFDPEAVALIRHLKAKGLVLIVFAAQRGKGPESGLSVQFTKEAEDIIKDVPTFLRRLADRMELNLAIRPPGKG